MAISVRLAGLHDVEAIAPLFDGYRQFYGRASDVDLARQFLSARLAAQQSVVFIAEAQEGAAVGFTQLYPSFSSTSAGPIFVLNDIFVSLAHRGQGVARSLLKAAEDFARDQGAIRLTLTTGTTNTTAQSVYEGMGWQRDTGYFTYHRLL